MRIFILTLVVFVALIATNLEFYRSTPKNKNGLWLVIAREKNNKLSYSSHVNACCLPFLCPLSHNKTVEIRFGPDMFLPIKIKEGKIVVVNEAKFCESLKFFRERNAAFVLIISRQQSGFVWALCPIYSDSNRIYDSGSQSCCDIPKNEKLKKVISAISELPVNPYRLRTRDDIVMETSTIDYSPDLIGDTVRITGGGFTSGKPSCGHITIGGAEANQWMNITCLELGMRIAIKIRVWLDSFIK